ncbi:hypothetical protein HYW53_01005 [Candidatus Giovannonibacteria bacterium]|nr:hypothetical protein [Candidatus Giovannonibacteria bacterium]
MAKIKKTKEIFEKASKEIQRCAGVSSIVLDDLLLAEAKKLPREDRYSFFNEFVVREKQKARAT